MKRSAFTVVFGIAVYVVAAVAEPTVLEPHKPIERRIGGGDSHDYLLQLSAGQYARIAIEQKSVNISISVFGPDGKERFTTESNSVGDTETAEIIANSGGTYRFRVAPSGSNAPAGGYAITLQDVETATQRDEKRVEAARAVSQAAAYVRQDTREARLKAIAKLEEALTDWRAAQDSLEEVKALRNLVLNYIEIGDRQKALEYATRAYAQAKESGDVKLTGRALDCLGEVQNSFADKRKAIEYYEQALSMLRSSGDRAGEGRTSSNLAVAYSGTGNKRKALTYFEHAKHIFRELQDRRMLAEVAGNMGVTYDNLGEYDRALEYHQNDLALERELGDRSGEAITLNNIGTAYAGLGAFQKALDAYTSALEINRSLDNRWNAGINLNNIAWVYANLGDRRRALDFYQQSLEIVRAVNDQRRIAIALNNIANIHADLGEYRKAIDIQNEALPLRRRVGDVDGEANTMNSLGNAYAKLGDRAKAREYFEQAMAIHRKSGNRHMMARTLRNLGSLNRETGAYAQARSFLDEALEISRAIHDRSGESEALGILARLETDRGDLAKARELAEQAVTALESVRLEVASPVLRASFFASARDLQDLYIEILMRLDKERPDGGFAAAALVASERGRARSLLEMLGESAHEIRRGVDVSLLNRERDLQRLLAAKAEQQTRLLSGKHNEAEAVAARKELDTLATELELVQGRIRETSSQYAALTQPAPLNLPEIQTKVLDEDTVLLEYGLGPQKSFLWTITPSAIHVSELPSRSEIESAARRVYELLTARNRKPANETAAARAARVRQADESYFAAASKISAMLLGPAEPWIAGKRVLIVGEGILQHLPFGALPDPASTTPMMATHEIVTAPSASVVAILRDERAGRKPAEKVVAIFADPVFSAKDARVTAAKRPAVLSAAATRSSFGSGAQDFARLRFSRNEAEEISRLAPAESTLKAVDFDASRETVMSTDLAKYRIVHFATHSLLDNEHAELSGVVLSLVDHDGRPQNGFLRLYDIYNLRLGCELVVLSACQTALGEEIKGEGLIGLTRAFLYAGAPRVVATLWEIDDRTTAELMKWFYEGLLSRGERPAAALRAAQVALWRSKGWDAPYYWGAFTLQGEWW